MKYFTIENNNLILQYGDLPIPKPHEVLIKIKASGVNRADIFQINGSYKPPQGVPNIPGLEVAGIIKSVGHEVKNWQVNDKVCSLLNYGGYAEYVTVDAGLLMPIAKNLTFEQAATLPEALFTVWLNLVEKAAIKKNQSILIHSAASGIGVIAIQLAKLLGAKVIATASSAEKQAACQKLGTDMTFNYKDKNFVAIINDYTDNEGVDIILDILGAEYFQNNLDSLKFNGKLLNIAVMNGTIANINLAKILLNNISIMGSTLRNQPLSVKKQITKKLMNKIYPFIESGKIKTINDRIFQLDKASTAITYMQKNKHIGKIVLINN